MRAPVPSSHSAPIRIAAGCTAFNALDIIEASIANLIAQGVTDLYIVDHASDEPLRDELRARFAGRARITVIEKRSRPFYQGAMMTLLLGLAAHDGADVFIPFDADEFIDCDDESSSLGAELLDWVRTEETEALMVPVVNYLQFRDVDRFETASLSAITTRVLSHGRPRGRDGARAIKRPYLERADRLKSVVRLAGIRDLAGVRLEEGSHRAYRGAAPGDELSSSIAPRLVIRHLPYRSRESLPSRTSEHTERRRLMGRAVDNRAAVAGESSDGLTSFEAWETVSVPRTGIDALVADRVRVAEDHAFERIADRVSHVLEGPRPATELEPVDTTARLDTLFTVATDVLGTFPAFNEFDRAKGQVRVTRAERELAAMRATLSWRITAPLRALRRIIRR